MSFLRPFLLLATVSFFLHLAWEKAHIRLYTGYEALEGTLPVYLHATFGDVVYTLIAVGAALFFRGERLRREPQSRDYALVALIGFAIAVFVEVKAIALGRWAYTDAMPLVFGLGLSPLLQMTVLLPLSVYITIRIARRFDV